MNIPLMIRQIRENRFAEAIITVKQDIALPAVLGRICSAPCENGCNRRGYDGAISVCALKRIAADKDLEQNAPYMPVCKPPSGKRVAVIGSGPTGLAAAYYLLQEGHHCDIFDQNGEPGGMLRYGVPDETLPKAILDAEIDTIRAIGANFVMNQALGKQISIPELQQHYDAVVLAIGTFEPQLFEASGITMTKRGILINRQTFATVVPGIYAGGNAIAEGRMAIRSAAQGKSIAFSVNQQLRNLPLMGLPHRFNSLLGKVRDDDVKAFLQDSSPSLRVLPGHGPGGGLSSLEAIDEANRCFHCDCRKSQSCRLRALADEYGADQQKYRISERKNLERIIQHGLLIYEPGKCIKCGLCVQITERSHEKLGLTFIRRGFNVRIAVPFDEELGKGLENVAKECVETCPTAALAWLDGEESRCTALYQ
jgi:ferredoxin